MAYLSIEEAKALLPKVGDVRMEVMTCKTGSVAQDMDRKKCTVVAVHPAHLWYLVQFENGAREFYKVPRDKDTEAGRWSHV